MIKISLALLCLCSSLLADTITGRVVAVIDGDTITILDDNTNTERKIQLYGIDAPEYEQAYSQQAKQALNDKVYNQVVRVEYEQRDQYGRIVGKVYNGTTYVNLEMVQDGMAWHYAYHARYDEDLRQAQAQAKVAKRGLWADKAPMAPWAWRRFSK